MRVLDVNRRFVRVLERRAGLVEFEFAIGEPELFVELLLPEKAFAEFCSEHKPTHLPANKSQAEPNADSMTQRLRDVSL